MSSTPIVSVLAMVLGVSSLLACGDGSPARSRDRAAPLPASPDSTEDELAGVDSAQPSASVEDVGDAEPAPSVVAGSEPLSPIEALPAPAGVDLGMSAGDPEPTEPSEPDTGELVASPEADSTPPLADGPSVDEPDVVEPDVVEPDVADPDAVEPDVAEPEPAESPGDDEPGDCAIPTAPPAVVGYGAATTGGGNATPVIVTTFAEAEAALYDYRAAFKDGTADALVLRYSGTFDFSTIGDVCQQYTLDAQILQIKEMENVTLEGTAGSSANFGIKINRARNVIVRNMTMGLLRGGGSSDAITIEGNGTNGDVEHVWIDHNELFSSTKDDCEGAGDTEFDGLIDIKKGARYITISYNHLHDHQKTGLIGHSDSDDMDRYVTFHHNWYENVVSRTPLHRFGYVHLFNNYYNQIASSGINVRMGGVALIESNYFENAVNPVTSRYSDEVGYWDLRDNYVGEGVTWTTESDTLANAEDWETTRDFPASELSYDYAPDAARCVKDIVKASAGATL
jgi:pectate lyase